jgi:hypothetical protein
MTGLDEDRRSPLPEVSLAGDADERARAVWIAWLESMARDPEVAMAAAMAYRELSDDGRDRWLHSLAADLRSTNIPPVAVFGPLLGVEDDLERRRFLLDQVEREPGHDDSGVHRALLGTGARGETVVVLVLPLYLDFVQVLACTLADDRFVDVRHDPIALTADAPREFGRFNGARLEPVSLKAALDLVAAAILRHKRENLAIPDAVRCLVDLLGRVGP